MSHEMREPERVKLGDVAGEILLDIDGLFQIFSIPFKVSPPVSAVEGYLNKTGKAALVAFQKVGGQVAKVILINPARKTLRKDLSEQQLTQLLQELLSLAEKGEDALSIEEAARELLGPQKPPYRNNGLFSEHFLTARLKDSADWREDAEPVRRQLLHLYEEKKALLSGANEAQTEEEFIKPVLKILGFAYSVQPKTTGSGGAEHPDYVLYASEGDKTHAVSGGSEERLFAPALAIGEAKYWERDLDKKRRGDEREIAPSAVSPSFQIARYLEATGVEWGVLTNGREWRLYWGRASDKQKRYYAIDLLRVLDEAEAFKYFYLFFRKEAFRDGAKPGFLHRAIEESEKYGLRVGEKLKDVVFEEAFPNLANGFLHYHRENHGPVDDGVLQETYRASLTLLYRLLFLLYAEDRELLPVDDVLGYRKHSLAEIRRNIAERLDRGERFSENSYEVWEKLATLFRVVDKGDQALRVPPYNGGLFHEGRYHFLESHKVADRFLVQALDELARQEDEDGVRRFVDYKYLTVRELGSVYEGLLEYELKEDHGVAYLENSEGKRHLTGSYYTPDYVVQYIVESVLAPLVVERKEAVRNVLEEHDRALRTQERNPSRLGAQALAALREKALDTLLDVKVVDPAMGSGHFLVAAVDYLSERFAAIITELNAEAITDALDEVRLEIKREMGEFGLELKDAQLSDINLLKRMVMKRSVFGVDLNEMAVELAKLSLWLDAFTVGAPLSFLDHHLRHGNSVVGMNKDEFLSWVEKENTLWLSEIETHIAGATLKAETLQKIRDLSPADISESRRLYQEAEEALLPLRHALDVYTAGLYAPKPKRGQPPHPFLEARIYLPALKLADLAKPPAKSHIAEAVSFARERRFFHWEFEFPEVFFPPAGTPRHYNPGFDAVVGNPPYVRQEQLSENKEFFKKAYADVWAGKADLYTYFFARAFAILRQNGRFGYISSRQFVKAEYGEGLRRLLAEKKIEEIVDFGENKVFDNAATFPAIFIAENAPSSYPVRYVRVSKNSFAEIVAAAGDERVTELKRIAVERASGIGADSFEPDSWTLATAAENAILQKMREAGVPLGKYVENIFYGIKTGYNKAFFIDEATRNQLLSEDPNSERLIKPLLVGDDVRHYYIRWPHRYLIFTHRGVNIEEYPAIKRYLEQFREQLEPYPDPAKWKQLSAEARKRWKGRKPGEYKWYEIQDTVAYHHLFEGPKILYPVIAKRPRFYMDVSGHYINDKLFAIPGEHWPLLAVLNSKAAFFYAKLKLSSLGDAKDGGRLELRAVHLSRLPVPSTQPDALDSSFATLVKNALEDYRNGDYSRLLKEIKSSGYSEYYAALAGELAKEMQALQTERLEIENGWVDWVLHSIPGAGRLKKGWLFSSGWVANGLQHGVDGVIEQFSTRRMSPQLLRTLKRHTADALGKLRPLYIKLRDTDGLINMLVYRLYGLSDGQIKVIENEE